MGHQVFETTSELRSRGGTVIATGPTDKMMNKLGERAKKAHSNLTWGDHFRIMKRRSDPKSLYMKCRTTGEAIYIIEDKA